MRAPGLALAAAAVLAAEGAALAVFAVIELVGIWTGEAVVVPTALALVVLTLIGALALLGFAVGTRRGHSLARSGGVVLQVLAVVIALASLTLQPIPWLTITAIGLPGIVGFVLLIASARREAEAPTAGE